MDHDTGHDLCHCPVYFDKWYPSAKERIDHWNTSNTGNGRYYLSAITEHTTKACLYIIRLATV